MTAMTAEASAVVALTRMDTDAFNDFVHRSLGNDTDPAVWDALTHPSVIARTRGYLGALHIDIQNQLTTANAELEDFRAECMQRGEEGKRDFFAAKGAQADWRRRTAGFKRLIDRRLALVKSRTAAVAATNQANRVVNGPGLAKRARKHNREALEALTRAVAAHRQAVLGGDGDESDDESLWGCLTSITAVAHDGEELPLIEWLETWDDLREDEGTATT